MSDSVTFAVARAAFDSSHYDEQTKDWMATLVSGQLPDGTPVQLPVDIGGVTVTFPENVDIAAIDTVGSITAPVTVASVTDPVTVTGTVSVNEPVTVDGTVTVSSITSDVTVDGLVNVAGVRDPNGTPTVVSLEVDKVGPWLVTVDGPHHEVHEGEAFTAHTVFTGVALNASRYLRVAVPVGAYPHTTFSVTAATAYQVEIFEEPTTTAPGTSVAVLNRNRASSNTSTVTVTHTPTVTADGTRLATALAGTQENKSGGSDRSVHEFILAPNKVYTVKVTSKAAGNDITITADWYQEGGA